VIQFSIPRTILAVLWSFVAICFWPVESYSDPLDGTAEEAGLRIATEAREIQKGFGNFTANLTMTLRNKQGKENQRSLRLKVIEVQGDGDRTLFVFDQPQDVKGTAFLVHAHKDKSDQQWLYLPALKRVKGISASKQSGSFMGSEFSYEDMGAVEVEKFTHRFLREEPCGDLKCLVLERIPKSQDSGYSRQLVWLDREELRTIQTQYFDRRDEHLKTMVVEDYAKYLDRFWRSSKITMTNLLTGKGTVLLWSDYEFGTDLDTNDFTRTALKRIR
jgi:outer membrane lipoprotein-sorting protein